MACLRDNSEGIIALLWNDEVWRGSCSCKCLNVDWTMSYFDWGLQRAVPRHDSLWHTVTSMWTTGEQISHLCSFDRGTASRWEKARESAVSSRIYPKSLNPALFLNGWTGTCPIFRGASFKTQSVGMSTLAWMSNWLSSFILARFLSMSTADHRAPWRGKWP